VGGGGGEVDGLEILFLLWEFGEDDGIPLVIDDWSLGHGSLRFGNEEER
jgi:hypothetical protein